MKLKISFFLMIMAGLVIWWAVLIVPDNRLHVYFCDVGQGDGAIVVRGSTQLVIDTGPGDKILNCLSTHMPFYDHTIEGVIVTHPQQDHMGGLLSIAQSYRLMHLFIPPVQNNIRIYRQLLAQYESKTFEVSNLYSGDVLEFNGLQFHTIWPTTEFVASHAQDNGKVLGWKTDGTDLNSFCIVGILTFTDMDVLFTGDADEAVDLAEIATGLLRPVEILKVPHHGSKTGMLPEWLALVNPAIAVISVGKGNSYGHPTNEALEMLTKYTNKIYRTDLNGTVELISDGKTYWIK